MNYLNLNTEKTEATVENLNILLADYHLYYQKLRNFHWNVIGENFFDLHAKFEEMYTDTLVKIDEVAERILTLRYQPISNLTDYLKLSNIEEAPSEIKDIEMVKILLDDHSLLLKQMRSTVKTADEGGDEGTIDLLGGYIRELEKTSWMLDSWRMTKTSNHKKS
ncbi:Dps family protein [Leeuwenhoekiella polynyae]|uniref:Starvation-inducible DNA-binding protein n=1 Tax=Leeuwenhoekiella polynyae TaxID=1550906 RepID=A0A4Q0P495_9FLAO|nr:DNA starvation/stationary phase protection protein [Leeuwenhoekiella polynyae]RXG21397.1 starvation-inducible DNA-binding protein [Leeuwenhoekiella polynyae]